MKLDPQPMSKRSVTGIALCAIFALCFAGCGGSAPPANDTPAPPPAAAPPAPRVEAAVIAFVGIDVVPMDWSSSRRWREGIILPQMPLSSRKICGRWWAPCITGRAPRAARSRAGPGRVTAYAEIVGFDSNSDGSHVTQPSPSTMQRVIDPECAPLDYIVGEGRDLDVEYVMNNNFEFGGINTSLIFRRHT